MSYNLSNTIMSFKDNCNSIKEITNIMDQQIRKLKMVLNSVDKDFEEFNNYFEKNSSSISKDEFENITNNLQPYIYGIGANCLHVVTLHMYVDKEHDKYNKLDCEYENIKKNIYRSLNK